MTRLEKANAKRARRAVRGGGFSNHGRGIENAHKRRQKGKALMKLRAEADAIEAKEAAQ